MLRYSGAYSKLCQISKMECFECADVIVLKIAYQTDYIFGFLWSKSKGGDKGIYTSYQIVKMCGMGGTYESSLEVSHRTLFSFFFHLMVIILSVSVCIKI